MVISKRVCAWCEREMGEIETKKFIITHGICEDCEKLVELYPLEVLKKINSLDDAVLFLDSTTSVIEGNDKALKALKKDFSEIEGVFPGDVINCLNAEEPEGCGHTSQCKGCVLREIVEKTIETGEPQKEISTIKTVHKNDCDTDMNIVVSTEAIGNKILLRIDQMDSVS